MSMHRFQFEKPPRPWSIVEGGRAVRIGETVVPLDDVAEVETSELFEPNVVGHLMAVGLFLGLGCLLMTPVLMQIAPIKELGGAVLFLGIGWTAVCEVRRLRAIHLHQVVITHRDGKATVFSTPEIAEAQALSLTLTAARLGRAPWPAAPAVARG